MMNVDLKVLRGKSRALVENYWDCCVPLDPVVFANALGIKVVYKHLNVIKSGYYDIQSKTIVINSDSNLIDRRFAIAKEIGRSIVLRLNQIEQYDHADVLQHNESVENALNQFALELLIPAIAVKVLMENQGIKDPVKLRTLFVVNGKMLYKRLDQLGYFL